MQSGEVLITGTNQIDIQLQKFPSEVHVKFKHEIAVPCNPIEADTLEYEVVTKSTGVFLHIAWSVSGLREVVWHAYY